ncbi:membrane protein insertion efficiency factor YidD [Mucilaginibacter aquariorum]|uniref:Membrane protein insertion efficiency factor YidD n=1 Tax=Mucilaginibacter aquariorum TaxID=2967225 RepID=A0ABT1T979_9SPHI|nr:membrane protein insertion efficiency factor YidD [Mucilaginibacter aquariorum]MCQ6960997.1 membrane protein insertion efficiency factor YidD [Mucilaginibacter aquariorum]
MYRYLVSVSETLLLCLICLSGSAQSKTSSSSQTSASDYIGFYQKFISGIRGQECPMYPSCSNFALSAFKEKNFAEAFVLTSDRLMRCGHDLGDYDLTARPTGFKYLDVPGADNSPKNLRYSSQQPYFAYADTVRDINTSLLFIKSLINNNYYEQAILEIKRVQFNQPFNNEVFINELICLKALNEYEKAIFAYETQCPVLYKNDPEILYQLATIYYKLDNFNKANTIVSAGLITTRDENQKARLYALQGLIYANLYNWASAKQSFTQLKSLPYRADVTESNIRLVQKAQELKFKSPAKASLLSIIPGLGYAYTGHTQTAVSSFLLNGVFAYATYSSIKKKNYGLASLTGLFSVSFYIANIYGSGQSAKRHNEQKRKAVINNLFYNINP